jgi:hypothetical protein
LSSSLRGMIFAVSSGKFGMAIGRSPAIRYAASGSIQNSFYALPICNVCIAIERALRTTAKFAS